MMNRGSLETESSESSDEPSATFAARDIGPEQEDPMRPKVFSWHLDKTGLVIGLLVILACALIIFTLMSLLVAGSIGQQRDAELPPAAPSQRAAE